MDILTEVEKRLGYRFHQTDLLKKSLIHRSYYLDGQTPVEDQIDNERLEFLGDAVFDLVIATYLYRHLPNESEGILSQLKEQMVDRHSLNRYAHKLDIASFILVGKGERRQLEVGKLMGSFFEAIVGAIYLDGGLESVEEFCDRHLAKELAQKIATPKRNWKRELQEIAHRLGAELPCYTLIEETGPSHQKTFVVSVSLEGVVHGKGQGKTKKEAEMQAAKEAIMQKERRESGDQAEGKMGLY